MDQYRVFGNPIKQSRSPFIHQSFAKNTQQTLSYKSEYVELDGFDESISKFIQCGGKGANVTAPFKEQALALCDQLSSRAKYAGAVNTLSFLDGKIIGDNTDGIGLVQDLQDHQVKLTGANILLLGAGGAAKGVILPLLEQQPASIVIANRTLSKAETLCEQFNNKKLTYCAFEQIEKNKFDLVINATSASLSGDVPPIPSEAITVKTACYDMVYGKEQSNFLKWAKAQGAMKTIDGLGMLVGQAAESFKIWRGLSPEKQSVFNALRKSLL